MTKPALALLVGALCCSSCGGSSSPSAQKSQTLVGAGSTFVYPLLSRWADDFRSKTGVTVDYGAIGSGGGIAAITNRSVDFGASDAPLSRDQASSCNACVQIPWALGGTSVAYNLPNAPRHLKLSGPLLAGMFLGTVTRWDDPSIARLNPGVDLPPTKVMPVFRSDASGTSYNFTDYLAAISDTWKRKVGVSTQPSFPVGQGAKGSSGVAGVIGKSNGAVGYVDVAYAQTSNLAYAKIRNAAGRFVLPDETTIEAAAAAVRSPTPNRAISLVEPPASAPAAYPIATFTYAIVPRRSAKAASLRRFLNYAVSTGQKFAPSLLFAPLPASVVAADRRAIATIRR